MKKHQPLLIISAAIVCSFLLQGFGGLNSKYSAGSPGGYSGSPGDGKNCVLCHGGSATPVNGWITSDVPLSGYVPGTSYTITVSVIGNGKKGFECSPQNITGQLLGILTAGPETQLTAGSAAVTHLSASTDDPKTWTFTWKAPLAGTGPVTFYGAFTVSKPVTTLSTLVIPEISSGIQQGEISSFSVHPNPFRSSFQLSYFLEHPQHISADILDLKGVKVMSVFEGIEESGNHSRNIQLMNDIAKGIYYLRLRNESTTTVKKIIIL